MKKLFFFALFWGMFSVVYAQITLTYAKHALKEGEVQHMLKADYVDPGMAGQGIVWDFSKLNIYGEEITEVRPAPESPTRAEILFVSIFIFTLNNACVPLGYEKSTLRNSNSPRIFSGR